MRDIKFRAWLCGANVPYMANWETVTDAKNPLFPFDDGVVPMQYTGLKDKNGVEIYEGDIVEDEHEKKHEIFYFEPYASFCYSGEFYVGLGSKDMETVEVIGNIYENPELLNIYENPELLEDK